MANPEVPPAGEPEVGTQAYEAMQLVDMLRIADADFYDTTSVNKTSEEFKFLLSRLLASIAIRDPRFGYEIVKAAEQPEGYLIDEVEQLQRDLAERKRHQPPSNTYFS